MKLFCEQCGEDMLYDTERGESETLVGYGGPRGHDHNDNCLKRHYVCTNDHRRTVSIRRRCSTKGCDWKGKETCFCHLGPKVEEWPA